MTDYRCIPNYPSNATTSGPRTNGVEFYVTADSWLKTIWAWRPTTDMAMPTQAAIWRISDGVELISVLSTTAASTATGWIPFTLATPYKLTANVRYAAGALFPGSTVPGSSNFWSTGYAPNGLTSGPLVMPNYTNATANKQGRYNSGSTRTYPNTSSTSYAGYGIDVTVSDTAPTEEGENYCSNPDARAAFGGWAFYGSSGANGNYITGVTGMTKSTAYRVTQGATADDALAWAPIHNPRRDMSGETWSMVMEAVVSAAATCQVMVFPYDASGNQLATTSGTAVAVAAGGILRQVVTATLPSGTRYFRTLVVARSLAAGATLTATCARYRRGSFPSLTYSDGSYASWGWDVRDGGTSRLQLAAEWKADTDSSSASTVGTSIGYKGTQYQPGPVNGVSQPIQSNYTPIPVEAAPGGRPGRASRIKLLDNEQRYEHNPTHREFVSGDDYFFSFSFYLDADFPLDATEFQVIEQMHGAPGTGSPVLAFEARNGKLLLTGGNARPVSGGGNSGATYAFERTLLASIQKNRWYNCVYRMLFSDQLSGGRYDVWVDGALVLEDYAPPCGSVYTTAISTEGGNTYRKQGFYHRPAIPGGTIRHAGSALANGYTAVDPTRTLTYTPLTPTPAATSGEVVPSPTVRGRTIFTPTGIASAGSVGSPSLRGSSVLTPSGVASPSVVQQPALRGKYVLTPSGVQSQQSVPSPVVRGTARVTVESLPNTPAVGRPSFTAYVTPAGISSAEDFGVSFIFAEGVAPSGIRSAQAFGQLTVRGKYAITGVGKIDRPIAQHVDDPLSNDAILEDRAIFYARGRPGETDVLGAKTIWASPANSERYTAGPNGDSAFLVGATDAGGNTYRGVQSTDGWLATPVMSFEAWIRIDNPASGYYQEPFNARTSPANQGWILYIAPDGRMKFSAGTGTGTNGEAGPTIPASYVPAGVWIHVVGTCDGVNRRLYVNGVLAGSGGGAPYAPCVPDQQLRIGTLGGSYGRSGAIDDVAVYDYVLSPEQVAAHYRGVPRIRDAAGAPTVRGRWTFTPSAVPAPSAASQAAIRGKYNMSIPPIASAERVGTPSIYGKASIVPIGVASREAFGTLSIRGKKVLTIASTPSSEAVMTPQMRAGVVRFFPTGLPSPWAFGRPKLTAFFKPEPIQTDAAFGRSAIVPVVWKVTGVGGIATREAFGRTYLAQVKVMIARSIETTEDVRAVLKQLWDLRPTARLPAWAQAAADSTASEGSGPSTPKPGGIGTQLRMSPIPSGEIVPAPIVGQRAIVPSGIVTKAAVGSHTLTGLAPAPTSSPTARKITDLTGPGYTDRYSVGGTDLGVPRLSPDGSRLVTLFGDSFEQATVGGAGWRSPLALYASPSGFENGLDWIGAAGSGDYAAQLIAYTHNSSMISPVTGQSHTISTILPTDIITIGSTMYMHVMVSEGLGNVPWTRIYQSTDQGETWGPTNAYWGRSSINGFFMIPTFEIGDDGYVYCMSTGWRDRGIILQRVPVAQFATPSAWEQWGWTQATGWKWGNPATVILNGKFGEMCLRRVEGKWVLIVFDAGNYRIDARVLNSPTSDVTAALVQTLTYGTSWDAENHANGRVAQLYGGYIVPGSTLAELHLVISQWNTSTNWPYKAMQFKGDISSLTPA